jgi:hypothetical protein
MLVWILPCEEVFNNALFYEDCCDLPPKPCQMVVKKVLNTMPHKRHFDFGFILNSACCDKRVAWELWDKIRTRYFTYIS